MKKLIVVLILGLAWAGTSEAAGVSRGAKGGSALNYTASVSSVSVPGAAVLYSVIMSTGATGDYVALFDASTTSAVTANLQTSALKTRCYSGSAITTTQCNYDPPLQFNLGLAAIASTAQLQAFIVYERGRVVQGY